MKKNVLKRLGAASLAAVTLLGSAIPALAAGEVENAYDEAYYATLDYYGGLAEGSVVKSYRLRSGGDVTDYGAYDSVENLTDAAVPAIADGKVTFTPEEGSDSFYFEGKTSQPYVDLPWTISVSYKLNGVPVKAEDLAGEKGLVEIALDVVPNPKAPEYMKTNLVLTAATAFNADDILSLEAEGAEVQLVGNLRAVMYMVLPGEEQHFVIKVGAESFEFAGLMFLAVPATLQQLEQVKDLKEAKEDTEDSLDAIDESLDVILDTLEGMSGSLNATASGLDKLNAARGSVSSKKDPVYDQADLALGDLDALADKLGTLDPYVTTASQAVTDTVEVLNELTATATSMKTELAQCRTLTGTIQEDMTQLRKMVETVEGYNTEENRKLIRNVSLDAGNLSDEMDDLSEEIDDLRLALTRLDGVSTIKTSDLIGGVTVEVNGQTMTVAQIQQAMQTAQDLADGYQEFVAAAKAQDPSANPSMNDFLTYYFTQAGLSGDALTAKVAEAQQLLAMANNSDVKAQLKELEQTQKNVGSIVGMVNTKIREINSDILSVTQPTADLLLVLQDLADTIGEKGFTDDLEKLTKLCSDLLEDMEAYEGDVPALLTDMNKAGDLLVDVSHKADDLLDRAEDLDGVLNTYEPTVQAALTDVQTLSGSLQSTLHDTRTALSAAEELLRTTGPELDEGTRQSLNGLSAALRKSTQGLDKTGTIRDAKDTINDLVDDKWDEHSGQVDTLLNIDAQAVPVSMTDERNAAPESVQYIMRTREIKIEEEETAAAEKEEEAPTTFWQRVKNLFIGLWNEIVGLFKR